MKSLSSCNDEQDESNKEIFICVNNNYEENKIVSSLVCSIFTIELGPDGESDSYSLVYGSGEGGGQVDQFFKYFDSGANIAVGDSSGGEWNSSWTYSNDDEAFSEEINPPEWTEQDSEALKILHDLKWKYLELSEDEDGETLLVVRPGVIESLSEFDANEYEDWTAYTSEEFDDEKLSNFSNLWNLQFHWG